MTTVEKKLASLNTIYAVVREWQRGAINHREMRSQLGSYLTAGQIDAIDKRTHRTIEKVDLAKVIAEVVGL